VRSKELTSAAVNSNEVHRGHLFGVKSTLGTPARQLKNSEFIHQPRSSHFGLINDSRLELTD